MQFISLFVEVDRFLFFIGNTAVNNALFDFFLPLITNEKMWLPVILIFFVGFIIFGDSKSRFIALLLVVSVGTTDLVSSRVIKKIVGRKRPCCSEPVCRKLIGCKTSKSMPSSHAANTASAATVIVLGYGWKSGWAFVLIAGLVGFSRIYVGVHYPLDVLSGFLVGIIISCLFFWLFGRLFKTFSTVVDVAKQTLTHDKIEER